MRVENDAGRSRRTHRFHPSWGRSARQLSIISLQLPRITTSAARQGSCGPLFQPAKLQSWPTLGPADFAIVDDDSYLYIVHYRI